MPLLSRSRRALRLTLIAATLATAGNAPRPARALDTLPTATQTGVKLVAIPDSQPAAVQRATRLHSLAPTQTLTPLICFTFADPQAAQAYADAVSDPTSLLYGQWLTPQEIGERFGPSQADYLAMVQHCQANGLQIIETPVNHMTLRVRGTVAQVEKAFGVQLNAYREAAVDAAKRGPDAVASSFYASATPVQVPGGLAGKISSIEGLESYTRPVPLFRKAKRLVSGPFDAVVPRSAYDVKPMYALGNTGAGRTVGVTNFVPFSIGTSTSGNAVNFINRNGLPFPSAGKATNIQVVTVGSSSGTSDSPEGDTDFQMVLGQAPLATIIIYDNGPDENGSSNPIGLWNREVSDNKVDIVTESYGWSGNTAFYNSAHTAHLNMTMQGITYMAASGDNGTSDLASTPYPDIDPEVLNIGGTTLVANNAPAYTWSSEVGWSGSGGGTSTLSLTFNKLPTWQKGRDVSTTNARNVPDLAFHASAGGGAYYFFLGGGSPQTGYIGTSFASPVTAGQLAIVEQYLISQNYPFATFTKGTGKMRLGRLADKLYAFNGRNDLFHDITSGNNGFPAAKYWDYVTGWGSVDWFNFATALLNPLAVTVTPPSADLLEGQTLPLTATVVGSNVTTVTWSVASGPGTVSTSGLYTAPASVTAVQTVTVQATSTLDTADPGTTGTAVRPNPVLGTTSLTLRPTTSISGTVSLQGIADPATTVIPVNPVTFVLTPTAGGSPLSIGQTLGSGGSFSLPNIPGNAYNLSVKGDKWLSSVVPVNTSGGSVSGLTFVLLGGDADNNNVVDAGDFGILVNAYGSLYDPMHPDNGYDARADLNNDGSVDVGDFSLLVNNYGATGQ